MKFLFIGDRSPSSELAAKIMQHNFSDVTAVLYNHGEPFPEAVNSWEGDWIISYKSDLILSPEILKAAKVGAVNIHPAPTRYRGIGGYHYAIKNGDKTYGVTSHFMDEKIDHGKIILTTEFPIHGIKDARLLKEITAQYCIGMLHEIVGYIRTHRPLPSANVNWEKKLFLQDEVEKEGGFH